MQNYQDAGVGTVIGGGSAEDGGGIRDHLDPRTSEAGMTLAVVVVAFVILLATIGKGGRGLGKAIVVGQFVLIVAAASIISQWAARTWALRHGDNRLAAAVTVAL
jgi:hypothetical protein